MQDGFWIHKDTGVITYFGADAEFIANGVMSQPPWIAEARVILLCSGITSFETTTHPSEGIPTNRTVFNWDVNGDGYLSNNVLKELYFGNANIEEFEHGLINSYDSFSGESPFWCIDFNSKVKNLGRMIIESVYNIATLSKPETRIYIRSENILSTKPYEWSKLCYINSSEDYTGIGDSVIVICADGQSTHIQNILNQIGPNPFGDVVYQVYDDSELG